MYLNNICWINDFNSQWCLLTSPKTWLQGNSRKGNAINLTIKNSSTQFNRRKIPVQARIFVLSAVGQLSRLKENKIFSLHADEIVQKFVFHELFHIWSNLKRSNKIVLNFQTTKSIIQTNNVIREDTGKQS